MNALTLSEIFIMTLSTDVAQSLIETFNINTDSYMDYICNSQFGAIEIHSYEDYSNKFEYVLNELKDTIPSSNYDLIVRYKSHFNNLVYDTLSSLL